MERFDSAVKILSGFSWKSECVPEVFVATLWVSSSLHQSLSMECNASPACFVFALEIEFCCVALAVLELAL